MGCRAASSMTCPSITNFLVLIVLIMIHDTMIGNLQVIKKAIVTKKTWPKVWYKKQAVQTVPHMIKELYYLVLSAVLSSTIAKQAKSMGIGRAAGLTWIRLCS